MKQLRNIFLGAVLCCGSVLHAQQDPMFSQYMFNTLAFNPAYAGSSDVFGLMALSRQQWVGFDGAPTTQTLTANTPLRNESLALGATLMHDKTGPVSQMGFYGDFVYRMRVSGDSRLAFGLKAGTDLYQADLVSLPTVEVDPANASNISTVLPNFGFGMFWSAPHAYVGVSAPKLLTNSLSDVEGVLVEAAEARHYFLIGGYIFDLSHDLKCKPSFMLRAVEGAPLSLDINANFLLRDRIWFGAMYRLGNALGVMAQYQVNQQLRIGYAFDMTTTQLGAYNAGTHELMVGYDFHFAKGRTISPRWF